VFVETVERDVGAVRHRCSARFMVRAEQVPGLCGVERFSQPSLQCAPQSAKELRALAAAVSRFESLTPKSARGFSVELEAVFRPLHDHPGDGNDAQDEVKLLQECFAKVLGTTEARRWKHTVLRLPRRCARNADCDLSHYCDFERREHDDHAVRDRKQQRAVLPGVCRSRARCKNVTSAAAAVNCSIPLTSWTWHRDSTVAPLSKELVEALQARVEADLSSEHIGVPMEVAAPGPPHVLSGQRGMRSLLEMLAALRHMGVQAGPSSGLHVHVNVGNGGVPGRPMAPISVAAIWMAYAKYQLVIDEMLTPGRTTTKYARPLFVGHCEAALHLESNTSWVRDDCMVRRMFTNIHRKVREILQGRDWSYASGDPMGPLLNFCDAVAVTKGQANSSCKDGDRYWQLNLMSLGKHGTLEFRAHSATHDAERVLRWTQFALAFVEHFGSGPGRREVQRFWDTEHAEDNLAELRDAQRKATADELFAALGRHLAPDTAAYYASRHWEAHGLAHATCHARDGDPPAVARSACAPGSDGLLNAHVSPAGDAYVVEVPEAAPPSFHALVGGAPVALQLSRFLASRPVLDAGFVDSALAPLANGSLSLPKSQTDDFLASFHCCCEVVDGAGTVGKCRYFADVAACPLVCSHDAGECLLDVDGERGGERRRGGCRGAVAGGLCGFAWAPETHFAGGRCA